MVATLRRALLAFYDEHKRDLPWRRTTDPYAIWVSEIMLQQTQVDVVKPRYAAFLATFPSVKALARASETQVCEAWAGLGYYRRARNLEFEQAALLRDQLEDLRKLELEVSAGAAASYDVAAATSVDAKPAKAVTKAM